MDTNVTTGTKATRPAAENDDGHLFMGAALIFVGLVFLADQITWWDFRISGHFWPFILLILGAARLVAPGYKNGCRRSRRSGVWLVTIGLWGLISEFELFGFDYSTSWPLLIVAAGLNMVWRSLEPHPVPQTREN